MLIHKTASFPCSLGSAILHVFMISLVTVLCGAAGTVHAQDQTSHTDPMEDHGPWTRDTFETLFPEPSPGWPTSAMHVQTLKTFAQKSGLEDLFNTAGAISGQGTQAPGVRYQLTRTYHDGRDSTHTLGVMIDSEDLEGASLVLVAHGYSHIEEGKPVPLDDAKKPLQDEVLRNGAQPFGQADHLGVYAIQDSQVLLWILVGDTGVIGYTCAYAACHDDLDALVSRTDFQRLDAFARFDHRQQNRDE